MNGLLAALVDQPQLWISGAKAVKYVYTTASEAYYASVVDTQLANYSKSLQNLKAPSRVHTTQLKREWMDMVERQLRLYPTLKGSEDTLRNFSGILHELPEIIPPEPLSDAELKKVHTISPIDHNVSVS